MNIVAIVAIVIALACVARAAHNMGNEVRIAKVRCTDLATGDIVVAKVRYTGTLHTFNRNVVMEYAESHLKSNGVIPSEIAIID